MKMVQFMRVVVKVAGRAVKELFDMAEEEARTTEISLMGADMDTE